MADEKTKLPVATDLLVFLEEVRKPKSWGLVCKVSGCKCRRGSDRVISVGARRVEVFYSQIRRSRFCHCGHGKCLCVLQKSHLDDDAEISVSLQ
jgi:hypothetical protein